VTRLHWVATRVHALTVEPGSADSLRLDDVSGTQQLRAGSLVAGLAVGVCGPTRRSCGATMDGRRPIEAALSTATSRWAVCSRLLPTATSPPATWWSVWCADRTRCRGRPRRMLKCLDRHKPSQRSTTRTSGCKSVAPPRREPRRRADQPRRRVSPGVITGTANDNGINALGDRIDQLIVDESLSAQERRPSARNTLIRH
jgi:hypothetical protein